MKKAKLALVAIAAITVVGAGLAFKSQKFSQNTFYYSTDNGGNGNLTTSLFSTTTVVGDGATITSLTTVFDAPITTLYLTAAGAE